MSVGSALRSLSEQSPPDLYWPDANRKARLVYGFSEKTALPVWPSLLKRGTAARPCCLNSGVDLTVRMEEAASLMILSSRVQVTGNAVVPSIEQGRSSMPAWRILTAGQGGYRCDRWNDRLQ